MSHALLIPALCVVAYLVIHFINCGVPHDR